MFNILRIQQADVTLGNSKQFYHLHIECRRVSIRSSYYLNITDIHDEEVDDDF